jgi:ATP-binding cassette subfamily F protein 3
MSYLSQDSGLDGSKTLYGAVLEGFGHLEEKQLQLDALLEKLNSEKDVGRLEKLSSAFARSLEDFSDSQGFYYRDLASSALRGLGFQEGDFSRPVSEFSGGQKMRAALAKALISEPGLLLLDEPTNYLDTDSLSWLEGALSAYVGAYIAISHDRYFLDRVATSIWHIERGSTAVYAGNYSAYLRKKESDDLAQNRANQAAMKEIARQKDIIAKLKSFNREKSVRAAESREKRLSKMEVPEKAYFERQAKIGFLEAQSASRVPLRLKSLSCGYQKSSPLIRGLDLDVGAGEKIGIAGKNAAGKTTLLKTIAGELDPLKGEVIFNGRRRVSYMDQEHEALNLENTALEELSAATGADSGAVRDVLGALQLVGDDAFKKIGNMSGGEKSRVDIAKLMLSSSTVLLLDEPTNHLDIPIREAFEEALLGFGGAALIVSHDRYLLSKIAERMVFFEGGSAYIYDMPYEEAVEAHSARFGARNAPQKESQKQKKANGYESGQNEGGHPASKNELFRARRRLGELVPLLEREEEKIREIESSMEEAGFFRDAQAANIAIKALDELRQKHAEHEDEWLSLTYLLEGEA